MIKDFNNWLSEGYYDPPEDEDQFVEKHENLMLNMESKMAKEGMDLNSDQFFSDLQELGIDEEFNDDLQKFVTEHWDDMYIGGYDSKMGEPTVSDEYERIEKEFDSKPEHKFPLDYKQRRKALDDFLLKNMIEKNWEAYKNIYKKYMKILHDKRGTLHGKKYGV